MNPEWTETLHHDGSARYVQLGHEGDPQLGDEALIRLRAAPDAPIETVLLRTAPDGEQHFAEMRSMPGVVPGEACRWWQAVLPLHMPLTGYRFLLFTSDGPFWYNGTGVHRYTPTDAEDFRILAGYESPQWVRTSVFYQIFPDRFANGDPDNDVRDGEYTYRDGIARKVPWGQPPAKGPGAMVEFYGGDLAGIEQHLDYLQDLGVNALYLNPIFSAYSNHRYDVTDYENVDPHLGGNQALVSLREATRRRGMTIMLDIVPNHCGFMHPWFQAALKDPGAPTAEFFTFTNHPDGYAAWLGVPSLPKLNYRSQALREIMYSGSQAVFRRWLKPPYSIDGWRLDVANMLARQGPDQLGVEVGQGIRHAVKEENPQAYLLGENFFDASLQLQGDMWDAVMNYSGFSKPVRFWLSQFAVRSHGMPAARSSGEPWSTQALVDTWQAFRAAIPWVIASQQFNLLGSHDTPRILHLVNGDPALNQVANVLLFTYPGVPCLYYGDEVGLAGDESAVRACMPWDSGEWDLELRELVQKLVSLRRSLTALASGGFQVLLVEADTLAFLRDTEQDQIVVVAHRSEVPAPKNVDVGRGAIADGVVLEELFSHRREVVSNGRLPLPGLHKGAQIWRRVS